MKKTCVVKRPRQTPFYYGVYILFKRDVIVYVGQSSQINRRIHGHVDKDYDTVLCVHTEQYIDLEKTLIYLFNPLYNWNPSGCPKKAGVRSSNKPRWAWDLECSVARIEKGLEDA